MKCMCNKRGVRQSDYHRLLEVLSVYNTISIFICQSFPFKIVQSFCSNRDGAVGQYLWKTTVFNYKNGIKFKLKCFKMYNISPIIIEILR